MAERLRYKRRGMALKARRVDFTGPAAAAQGYERIASAMGQMSNFAARQTEIQMQAKGASYGALHAPTTETLEEAYNTKTQVSMPGGDATVFDRAVKVAALNATSDQLEVLARKKIGEIVLSAYENESAPDKLAEDIDAVIFGYAGTLETDAPSLARSFQAKMSIYGHAQYQSYSRSLLTGSTKAALNSLNQSRILHNTQAGRSMVDTWGQ